MALLQTLLTDGGGRRWVTFLKELAKDPTALKVLTPYKWSERTIIALVMQNLDNSITTYTKKGLFGRRKVTSKQGHGQPNPSWIPAGNEATRRIAEKIDGRAGGTWGDVFNIPLTAHFLGGCTIASEPSKGVIDPYHRVWGLPDAERGRRFGRVREPGRQPVADDLGAGRACGFAVAEQGREGSAAGAGRGIPAPEPGRSGRPGRPGGAPAALVLPIVEIRNSSVVPDTQKHGVA